MCPVVDSDVKSAVPFVKLDVEFYSSVEKSGTQENSFGFLVLLAIKS